MNIDELARLIQRRKLEKPNLGAIALMTLSACHATTIVREIPRAMPAAVVVSKRQDDDAALAVDHGPELQEPQLAPEPPPAPTPPGGRAMTHTTPQEPEWSGYGAVYQTLPQHAGAAIIDAITRAQISARSGPDALLAVREESRGGGRRGEAEAGGRGRV
jgi:hypothetical protein